MKDLPIRWYTFKERLPKNESTIIVEDHEGNQSTGIWWSKFGFEGIDDIPIGYILKWSLVSVVIYSSEMRTCKIFYENGKEVDMDSLYDDNPLFQEQKGEENAK